MLRLLPRSTLFPYTTLFRSQLTKYVSNDLSPVNFSGSTDRFLDALYVAQAMTTDPRQRAKMVHDFERHALTEAYTVRSEEHTSELQSPDHLVCRLLLEKKKK